MVGVYHSTGTNAVVIPEVTFPKEFTFAAWLAIDAGVSYPCAVAGRETAAGLISLQNASTVRIQELSGGTTHDFAVLNVASHWHHLVVTRSAADAVTVYLDGLQSETAAATIAGVWRFTRFAGAGGVAMNGRMADVSWYNWSLTAQNVSQLYRGLFVSETGYMTEATAALACPVRHYSCNEGSGNQAKESRSATNDGSISAPDNWHVEGDDRP